MTLLYAVLRGDPKEKFASVLDTLKGLIPGGIPGAADLENMLNSEENQSSLKDIMELVMKTRLASLVGDVIQSLQYTDLDIDFEDPEKLMEMVRDPMNHPALKEIMERAQMILKEKIETGKINQQDLRREIETIRAKFQSAFGKYLNEAIVGAPGNTTGNTGEQILSNHPEARRARMLARMQKKQREGGGGGGAPNVEADAEAARRADAIAEELLREEEADASRAKARAQKKQPEKQLRK
jgi:DNA-binding protein Fis